MTTQQTQGCERAFQILNFWKIEPAEFNEFYKETIKETNDYQALIEAEHAKLNTPIKAKSTEIKVEIENIKTQTKTKN